MFETRGVNHIASITELRTSSEALDLVEQTGESVLIQRNGDPEAVIMSVEEYERRSGEDLSGHRPSNGPDHG